MILRLLADENLNRVIVTGVCSQFPSADFPRAQDFQLNGTPDPELLEWAAQANRIIVSHDVSTMTRFASDRLNDGLHLSGLLLIPSSTSVSVAIAELVTICQCSDQSDWENLIAFLPL